jgi:DNA-directed RNA polymerase III subunit RPC6
VACSHSYVNQTTQQLVEFVRVADQLHFRSRSATEADKVKDISGNERILYAIIKAAGNKGIWIKDIKARSNLHSQVVTTCIKNMEKRLIIKAIKSIKVRGVR